MTQRGKGVRGCGGVGRCGVVGAGVTRYGQVLSVTRSDQVWAGVECD